MRAEPLTVSDVGAAALPLVIEAVDAAVAARGRAIVSLCGGSSPLPLYRRLAAADLPWDRLYVTFGDERFVPLDHPDSNAGAAIEAFLGTVPVPEEQLLTWPILDSAWASAEAYRGLLERTFGGLPTVDLTLLGLGDDAHTASLFPGTGAVLLDGPTLAVQAPDYAQPGGWRLTMSAPALSDSRQVFFLVAGAGKVPALRRTFGAEAPEEPLTDTERDALPALSIGAHDRLLLITDVEF